ncbi:MAG: PTS sugar transporter subunit IIA [Phycisphaerales bacterium]|nr:PTS sugar transporter subunit IIA [Phycisphaerales bacterium]
MKLTDIVAEQAIVANLKSTERDDVLAELVDALVASGSVDASIRDDIIARLYEREKKGTTGFGKGVAVPHAKHDGLAKMVAAVGLSQRGVDFAALDREPVYSIFLLISPAERPDEHLQAMEVIFTYLSKDSFRRFLRQADSVDAVTTLLEEADSQQFAG